MNQIIYTKIGQAKGQPRVWLEGRRLDDAGIHAGLKYKVKKDEQMHQLTIEVDEDGPRVVSRKKKSTGTTPVIDLNAKYVREVFGDAEQLKAVVYEKKIIITITASEKARIERLEYLKEKLENNQPLDFGSISTGLGVADHAVHQGMSAAGQSAQHVFGNELEHNYMEASLANNPIWSKLSLPIEGCMQFIEQEDIPKLNALVAGIPCTGASRAGKAKNKNKTAEQHETAGHLFYHFLNIVKWSNAAIVILENVPDYQHEVSAVIIRKVLEEWGYEIEETVLNGNEYGALENRDRYVMVARTKGMKEILPYISPLRVKEDVVQEILEDVPEDSPRWNSCKYLKAKQVKDIKKKKGFRMQMYSANDSSVNTIPRGYAKWQSTNPLLKHPTDPELLRLFTKHEHARLKTVPEYLVRNLSATVAHQLLGQSVIHTAFVAIGVGIAIAINNWFEITREAMTELLPDASVPLLPVINTPEEAQMMLI